MSFNRLDPELNPELNKENFYDEEFQVKSIELQCDFMAMT